MKSNKCKVHVRMVYLYNHRGSSGKKEVIFLHSFRNKLSLKLLLSKKVVGGISNHKQFV